MRHSWFHSVRDKFPAVISGRMDPHAYPIHSSKATVPLWVWLDRRFVVQRFLAERKNERYAIRRWFFFGESEFAYLSYGSLPIVSGDDHAEWERLDAPPDELRKLRTSWGLTTGRSTTPNSMVSWWCTTSTPPSARTGRPAPSCSEKWSSRSCRDLNHSCYALDGETLRSSRRNTGVRHPTIQRMFCNLLTQPFHRCPVTAPCRFPIGSNHRQRGPDQARRGELDPTVNTGRIVAPVFAAISTGPSGKVTIPSSIPYSCRRSASVVTVIETTRFAERSARRRRSGPTVLPSPITMRSAGTGSRRAVAVD